ncbi:CHAT domain-containing protein [Spirulina sp. 06S082]|uniref:CHAT domain-containing protein n=1 Tax=Spirulina sp. 06S082 TaxID=3110248 RepID=UPI002B1F9587|nr:CHAT domain-containing protein [Spirulina sp. 06S082]MEA5467523.1 CHAT domain-containing protein [Spirulina sp. 06S082]
MKSNRFYAINLKTIVAGASRVTASIAFSAFIELVLIGVITDTVSAQSIISASDGTGTSIQQNGNQFDIQGGARSQDGGNLFHSFEQFGLSAGEVANFLSSPEINNILGRVVGGDPSLINGLIQVTGGNANLFLMNPAGIIFGQNASINVPGDFFATTATGIGFGEENWFEAIGSSNYQSLVGDPDRFAFDLVNSGSIINAGNLAVNTGQSLTLLAGNTINTGTLSAPEGTINLTAVPGTNLVRLSREGNVLSLEFAPPRNRDGDILPFSPLALPELLTGTGMGMGGGGFGDQTPTEIPPGTGTAIASGRRDVAGEMGGRVNVFGDRVGAISATIDASGNRGGGTILFGGEQQGQGTVPNARQIYISEESQLLADATETGDGGRIITFASENASIHGILSARGGETGGNGGFIETSGLASLSVTSLPDISALVGRGGEWLIDPYNIDIVAGSGNSNINTLSPFTATGNGATLGIDLILAALVNGDVTISTGTGGTQDGDITLKDDLIFNLATERTLTLSASGTIWLKKAINGTTTSAPLNLVLNGGNSSYNQPGIRVQDSLNSKGGDITMVGISSNQRGVWIQGDIDSEGGNISLTGTSGNNDGIWLKAPIASGIGDITLTTDRLDLNSGGGDKLSGSGNLILQPLTPTLDLQLGGSGSAGTIFLTDNELSRINDGFNAITIGRGDGSGTITVASDITFNDPVTLRAPNGNGSIDATGGNIVGADNATIALEASQDITTSNITNFGRDVTMTSTNGAIATENIDTSSNSGDGGKVSLTSPQDIKVNSINTASTAGKGGDINAIAGQFFRATGTFLGDGGNDFSIYSGGSSGGGQITLNHGGKGITPFTIGNAAVNGVIGGIGDGSTAIIPNLSLQFTYVDGQIQIVSVDGANTVGFSSLISIDGVTSQSIGINGITSPRSQGSQGRGQTIANLIVDVLQKRISHLADPRVLENDRFILSLDPLGSNTSLITELTFDQIDRYFTQAFEKYFASESETYASSIAKSLQESSLENSTPGESDRTATSEQNSESDREIVIGVTQASLDRVDRATGVKPSIIYAIYAPALGFSSLAQDSQPTDQLYLMLVTAKAEPILYKTGISRRQIDAIAKQFRRGVTDVRERRDYLSSSQKLYQWLISPLEADLEKQEITHLTFILDEGLRSLPIAALHDGEKFIVERYSVSLMPSLSLSDLSYTGIRGLEVLAMGSSKFSDRDPLPAVPIELDLLSSGKLWQGESYLNEDFTIEKLQAVRDRTPYRMIHLATHSDFLPGHPSESYIQVGNERLGIDRLRELGWHDPVVELLVLSACRTALGDRDAELGFAGIAAMAGVKSTLGSLWRINDVGSLGFMSAFYEQLQTAPIKAEAVRQAQLAMLAGKIRLENGELVTLSEIIPLNKPLIDLGDRDFTHPYYWSSFTLIGTPW